LPWSSVAAIAVRQVILRLLESKIRLGMVVLPAVICGKVEGFGDGRTGGTAEPEPEGFDANSPGP